MYMRYLNLVVDFLKINLNSAYTCVLCKAYIQFFNVESGNEF